MPSKQKFIPSLVLFTVSFLLLIGAAILRNNPGYMDEAYYYMGAKNLYVGNGFSEMVIWNYLGDPIGLPQPSHLYWMPGASIIGWLGMVVLGSDTYVAACLMFSLLGACIPVAAYQLGLRFFDDGWLAILAAGFALAGGYYFVYYSAVETFSVYTLLGAAFVAGGAYLKSNTPKAGYFKAGLLGVMAGLMHLTRADGILWAAIGMFVLMYDWLRSERVDRRARTKALFLQGMILLTCYFVIMAPWYFRNIQQFSSFGAPGSQRSLFLTKYDDLYNYPGETVSFQHWIESGLSSIVVDRFKAAGINFLSVLGVQHLVFLLPFVLISLWNRRKEAPAIICLTAWGIMFFVMSFVFPYAGSRGGFFHSGSAVQVWIYLFAVAGFWDVLRYLGKKRGWNVHQAKYVLGGGFLLIYIVVSLFLFAQELVDDADAGTIGWASYGRAFYQIEAEFETLNVPKSEAVMVNDPPSNFVFTERASLAIPNGGEDVLQRAMENYGVRYFVLQENHPVELTDLWLTKESDFFDLLYLAEEFAIWKLKPGL